MGPDGTKTATAAPPPPGPGTNLTASITNSYVHAGGALVATIDSNQAVHFQLSDWLGTRRFQADANGNMESTFWNRPFGDTDQAYNPSDPTAEHFTGKETDAESGNDYFGARYYTGSMGRFLAPDNGSDQHSGDPQSWNLYSYVRNNPLVRTDPNGQDCMQEGEDGSASFSGDDCSAEQNAADFSSQLHDNDFDDSRSSIDDEDDDGNGDQGGDGDGSTSGGGFSKARLHHPPKDPNFWTSVDGNAPVYNLAIITWGVGGSIPTVQPYTPGPVAPSKSQYGVPGTECSRGCHPEPFKTHFEKKQFCHDLGTLGLGGALLAFPGVDAAAAWAAYIGGGMGAVYGYFNCQ